MVLAMLSVFVTVLSGVVVLALWFEPDRSRRRGQPVALGFTHATLAGTATVAWMVFAVGRGAVVGAVSLALLAGAAVAGAATVVVSHRRAKLRRAGSASGDVIEVPVAVLVIHGLLATAAVASAVAAFVSR